ncbi:MAG: Crp/Fnr family transcriptional regulator, partial [Microcoleus sp.]
MTLSTYTPGLYASFRHQTFSPRQLVPVPSKGLLRIERGAVRTVTWSDRGTAITLGYWGVGDAVGQPLSGVQPYQIECKSHVEMSYIPANLCDRSLDEIFQHIQQTQAFFCMLRSESLRDRLLQLLVLLGKKFGRQVAQGLLIDLRLTHQEISESLGITRITVTRLMAKLEEEGFIDRSRPQYIVLTS